MGCFVRENITLCLILEICYDEFRVLVSTLFLNVTPITKWLVNSASKGF